MWWTQTPKLMKPMATSDGDDPRRSRRVARRANTGMIIEIMPGRGHEEDVHLGVAPEPEQVLVQQRAAAARRVEERGAEEPVELEQAGGQRSPPAPRTAP